MPPEFSLTQDALDDQRQVVAVAGEIDLFTAPELKAAIGEALESGRTRIVVDLTATTFLDSTALGVLIGAVKRLRSRDGVLTIVLPTSAKGRHGLTRGVYTVQVTPGQSASQYGATTSRTVRIR